MGKSLAQGRPFFSEVPATPTTLQNASRVLLVDWSSQSAESVEVALTGQYANNPYLESRAAACYAGAGYTVIGQAPPLAGFFTIEYGFGGMVRRRVVDASSARVFLGVCDNVRVFVTRLSGNTNWADITDEDMIFSASIGVSSGGSYDELCNTAALIFNIGDAPDVSLVPPEGAYAWEASASAPDDAGLPAPSLWGSAQPDLLFSGTNTEDVLYRFASYQIIPSVRRFKVPWQTLRVLSRSGALLTNTMNVFVRWYLNS